MHIDRHGKSISSAGTDALFSQVYYIENLDYMLNLLVVPSDVGLPHLLERERERERPSINQVGSLHFLAILRPQQG